MDRNLESGSACMCTQRHLEAVLLWCATQEQLLSLAELISLQLHACNDWTTLMQYLNTNLPSDLSNLCPPLTPQT